MFCSYFLSEKSEKRRNYLFVVMPWIGEKNLLHLSVLPKGEMGSEAQTVEVMMKRFPHCNGTSCVCVSLSQSIHLSTPPPVSSAPHQLCWCNNLFQRQMAEEPSRNSAGRMQWIDRFHQWRDLKTHPVSYFVPWMSPIEIEKENHNLKEHVGL